MKRPHPILNNDYQNLAHAIDEIAREIGGKLGRNKTYDERGLTDEFIDLLGKYFSHVKLSKYFINMRVHKPSEKRTGADILMRVIVNRAEVQYDRYVLIQAKKYLIDKKQFSETNQGNAHLSAQVLKLHNYNPEFSYLLLYSTNSEPSANFVFDASRLYIPFLLGGYPISSSSLSAFASFQYCYPMTFLRTKTWEKFVDTSPGNLLNFSDTLPNFLLDDLLTGKIGKEWDEVIEKAQGEFSIVITIIVGQG